MESSGSGGKRLSISVSEPSSRSSSNPWKVRDRSSASWRRRINTTPDISISVNPIATHSQVLDNMSKMVSIIVGWLNDVLTTAGGC